MVAMRTQFTPPTKTLLIDNHDSYTFNLYQLIAEVNGGGPAFGIPAPLPRVSPLRILVGQIAAAVRCIFTTLNGTSAEPPTVVPNDDERCASLLHDVRRGVYDSIVISPGPGTPHNLEDVGTFRHAHALSGSQVTVACSE